MLASGTTQQRWKDFDVFAYEREGGSRLLVALNNDPNGPHTIQVATGFGANVHLKELHRPWGGCVYRWRRRGDNPGAGQCERARLCVL